ncbi:hypothetical protein HK096_010499, partial [Nowakowskiella sp. JEL0078]
MEEEIHEWCMLEYLHMAKLVGATNLYLTGMSPVFISKLPESLKGVCCTTRSVEEFLGLNPASNTRELPLKHIDINMDFQTLDLSKIALLDPSAPEPLMTDDSSKFEYLLFGGILGDDPPKDRTGMLRVLGFKTRHLGPVQMTTDTAVHVSKRVVINKTPLDQIPYVDRPDIKL